MERNVIVYVHILGDKESISWFNRYAEFDISHNGNCCPADNAFRKKFSLESFIQTPVDVLMTQREVTAYSEYTKYNSVVTNNVEAKAEWRKENWGTPADVSNVVVHHGDSGMLLRFEAVDSAPLLAFESIAPEFKDLTFSISYFAESGKAGTTIFKDGFTVEDITYEGEDYATLINIFRSLGFDVYDTSKNLLLMYDIQFDMHGYRAMREGDDGWIFVG